MANNRREDLRRVDQHTASAARVYDYLLGGGHNFAVDRKVAERFLTALPSARSVARLNRAFLRRAVMFCCEQGIRQFLDVGSGIPAVGNVHEVAQAHDPRSRVVYVDYEPVACAYAQLLLQDNDRAEVVQADMLRPATVLGNVDATELLDFSEPIGLIMAGVVHFVPYEVDVAALLRHYRRAVAPGSYLALSHFTADICPEEMSSVVQVMNQSADPIYPRSHAEITAMFGGFELVEPGVVGTAMWRPEQGETVTEEPGSQQIYAGVARKRQEVSLA